VVPSASGLVFIFCPPILVFGKYRGGRLPFSCFALLDSFSAVPRASGLVFIFYTPKLIFDGIEGVRSRFHVLHARTHFRRYRRRPVPFSSLRSWTYFRWCGGRRVSFSCFARPDAFSVVPTASGLVLMFCAPERVFGGTEGVGSRFLVLRSKSHFRQYRGRRDPFSCFPRRDSFSAVPRASALVFRFCAPGLVSRGIEGIRSSFHVLGARTRFWRYQGCQLPFSCFGLPYSFSTVPRASCPVYIFCAPVLIFGGNEGVDS
jgi:hypothetical protein